MLIWKWSCQLLEIRNSTRLTFWPRFRFQQNIWRPSSARTAKLWGNFLSICSCKYSTLPISFHLIFCQNNNCTFNCFFDEYVLICRTIEASVGCTLMVSKHQNFDSEWRVIQCKGNAEQVSQTKNEIDKLLREAILNKDDSTMLVTECHIVNSVPITFGKRSLI